MGTRTFATIASSLILLLPSYSVDGQASSIAARTHYVKSMVELCGWADCRGWCEYHDEVSPISHWDSGDCPPVNSYNSGFTGPFDCGISVCVILTETGAIKSCKPGFNTQTACYNLYWNASTNQVQTRVCLDASMCIDLVDFCRSRMSTVCTVYRSLLPTTESTSGILSTTRTPALPDQRPPPLAPPPAHPVLPTTIPQSFPVTVVIVVAGAVVVLVVALCLSCIVFTKLRTSSSRETTKTRYTFAPQFTNRAFAPEYNLTSRRKNAIDMVAPEFKAIEILDYSHIKEAERLGNGKYGEVFKGEAMLRGQKQWTVVAIKKPKNFAMSEEVIDDFKNEISLMLELGKHPNIMGVLGCSTVCEPYYLITDYMKHGDLLHFLQKCTEEENAEADSIYKINTFNQLQIARQIADGMAYVSLTRFFHGDLAARNILVGDDLLVKITDFGLTDDLYQKGYTRLQAGVKRPYKWYSPESIEHQYCTAKTDIWSFGVLMWEIITFGHQTPYHGMSIAEVLHRLKTGYRMPCAPQTPHFMEKLINSCWQLEPRDRPEFPNLLEGISFLLARGCDDVNYVEVGEEPPQSPTEIEKGKSLIYTLNLMNVDPAEVSSSADSAYVPWSSCQSVRRSGTCSGSSAPPLTEDSGEKAEGTLAGSQKEEVDNAM